MNNQEIQLVLEELEMKSLRLRIYVKKIKRDLTVLNHFYTKNKASGSGEVIITVVKRRTLMLSDIEIALLELTQNTHYFKSLLNHN